MDLVFKRKGYQPASEFWGDLSIQEFHNTFGVSSTFIINLKLINPSKNEENIYSFTFDSGAFISYAPDFILEDFEIGYSFEGFVRSAMPKDECKIKVRMAKLSFKILDDNDQESNEITAWFAFHPFDRGPFLLGMKDVIEKIGFIKKLDEGVLILQI